MPAQSMTGYGSANIEDKDGNSFLLEVKSVNHRYLKVVSKLPDFLNPIQFDLEGNLKSKVQRGSVLLTIKSNQNGEDSGYQVSTEALDDYLVQIQPLIEKHSLEDLDLGSLLSLPGVVTASHKNVTLTEDLEKKIHRSFQKALKQMLEMRNHEGKELIQDLQNHLKNIRVHLKSIEKRLPNIITDYKKKLRQRIDNLLEEDNIQIEPSDLAKELAIYVDKTDIAEEVTRLHSHLQQFEKALKAKGAIGRKLDFLAQEMLREANTMGAKVSDIDAVNTIVEIKTLIDKIKEQVQNIE